MEARMMICHDCEGEGVVEFEYTRSNNPDSPYGGLRTGYAVCETCGGSGEIEEDEDDWD